MRRASVEIGLAVLAALVAACLALSRAGLWAVSSAVVVALVVATAALSVATTTFHAVDGVRSRRLSARRDVLDDVLEAARWAVVDATGLDARDLAVAVYEVRPRRWWRTARLVRAHRVRSGRRPVSSEVRWAPGKGVVGRCVSTGNVVAVDLRDWEAAVHTGKGAPAQDSVQDLDAEQWQALPEADRWGLDLAEFRRLRGKYGVVVAVPVVDDTGASSRVTGCVALDGPAGELRALSGQAVVGVLASAGRLLHSVAAAPAAVQAAAAPGESGQRLLREALARQGSPLVQPEARIEGAAQRRPGR